MKNKKVLRCGIIAGVFFLGMVIGKVLSDHNYKELVSRLQRINISLIVRSIGDRIYSEGPNDVNSQ